MNISLIIPAYNEAKHISHNLKLLTDSKLFHEIIVVNDGSTDNTGEIVRHHENVTLIDLKQNHGKTGAILEGVKKSSCEVIAFYDADLIGMKKEYLKDMIDTFQKGFDMVIMDKGAQPWVFRNLVRSIPAESGTRILKKSDLLSIKFDTDTSFDLEPKINDYFLENTKTIAVTDAPTVHDPRKYQKYSFIEGVVRDISGAIQILTINGIRGIPKTFKTYNTIQKLHKSRVDEEK